MKLQVPSATTKGKTWDVELRGASWTCECPRFAFSKRPQQCHHTEVAEYAHRLLETCVHVDNGEPMPDRALCRQCLVKLLALTARKVRAEYVRKTDAQAKVAAARRRRTQRPRRPRGSRA